MNINTDHRLSDSDLTVLVERAAQGSWDSQLGPASGTMWDEVSHVTKNSYREQVLSIIFHGTKALHELGWAKNRTIYTIGELSGLAEGAVFRASTGAVFEIKGGHIVCTDSQTWWSPLADWLPVTVLHEPEAAA